MTVVVSDYRSSRPTLDYASVAILPERTKRREVHAIAIAPPPVLPRVLPHTRSSMKDKMSMPAWTPLKYIRVIDSPRQGSEEAGSVRCSIRYDGYDERGTTVTMSSRDLKRQC